VSATQGIVDLRSDTVTRPTEEMRDAMGAAEVGDDAYGEDPTVNRLQTLAAALLGKEAALFVPSGTMANQIAVRALSRPGTQVVVPERTHVYRYEAAAAPMNAGVQLVALADVDGVITAEQVDAVFEGSAHHLPSVSMVWIENTHMPAHGRPLTAGQVGAVAAVARARGVPLYCDGARIWNAAVALGVSPAELVAECDAMMFCLSKGLGAPVGSVLCGSAPLIAEARSHRQRLGGGMRQAGVIAAAGIVALETMVERLADDHVRARRLADAIAERFPSALDPANVRTNIVCCPIRALPGQVLERLRTAGILAGTLDASTVRFVVHKDVDDDGIERACRAIRQL
jgi:threonine aldolase